MLVILYSACDCVLCMTVGTALKPTVSEQRTAPALYPKIPCSPVSRQGRAAHTHSVPSHARLSGPLTGCSYRPDLQHKHCWSTAKQHTLQELQSDVPSEFDSPTWISVSCHSLQNKYIKWQNSVRTILYILPVMFWIIMYFLLISFLIKNTVILRNIISV